MDKITNKPSSFKPIEKPPLTKDQLVTKITNDLFKECLSKAFHDIGKYKK